MGDNQRFAIWQNNDQSGLLYDATAFPGFSRDWDLKQAEAYIRTLLEEAPADFELSVRVRILGQVPEDDVCWVFDSRKGFYSEEGTASSEEIYGKENLTLCFEADQTLLNELYISCKKLWKLPEEMPASPALSRDRMETEIRLTADGKTKYISYSGASSSRSDIDLLSRTLNELKHDLRKCAAFQKWQIKLDRIATARRLAVSWEMEAVLKAAFDKKYGPGKEPDFFLGIEYLEGGYLQVWIRNDPDPKVTEQHMAEIREILKDFKNKCLFGVK